MSIKNDNSHETILYRDRRGICELFLYVLNDIHRWNFKYFHTHDVSPLRLQDDDPRHFGQTRRENPEVTR